MNKGRFAKTPQREGRIVKENNQKVKKIIIRVITALSFTLFVLYEVYILTLTDTQRSGRIMGIVVFLFITLASYMALIHRRVFRVLRMVLLIAGLLELFLMKLINVPAIFGSLNLKNTPSVLNCAIYVFAQLGTLILLFYYLAIRIKKKIRNNRKISVCLMSVVIVLFVSCLLMECVLMLKFRVNIEHGLGLKLLSRIAYCMGFVGTAVGFMIPSATGISAEEQYINKEQGDADIMVTSPQTDRSHYDKEKMRHIAHADDDFMMTAPQSSKSHSDKNKMRHMAHSDDDVMVSAPKSGKSHSDKNKMRHMAHADDDFMMTSPKSDKSHSDKKRHSNYDDTLVFSDSDDIRNHTIRYRKK